MTSQKGKGFVDPVLVRLPLTGVRMISKLQNPLHLEFLSFLISYFAEVDRQPRSMRLSAAVDAALELRTLDLPPLR